MPRLELGDVAIVFDDSGDPDLPPLVLLHGLSSARSTWRSVTELISGRFRVLAFDQRGHGESSHALGTYTLDHYVPDTIAFLERVVAQPAVIVGHSLGGVVAYVVARERPDLVRGAFLEDPPLYRAEDDPNEPSSGVARMFPVLRQILTEMQSRKAGIDEYVVMIRSAPAMNGSGSLGDVLGEEGVRAQARAFAGFDPEVFTPAIERTGLVGAEPSRPVTRPLGVLRADPELAAAFTTEDAEKLCATNPHASVAVITGASHAIHDEQPERFVSELVQFVAAL